MCGDCMLQEALVGTMTYRYTVLTCTHAVCDFTCEVCGVVR